MRWTYDACSNADLEEVAFAVMGVSAILEYVDLSSAPRDATYAAMCLLGCWQESSPRRPCRLSMR